MIRRGIALLLLCACFWLLPTAALAETTFGYVTAGTLFVREDARSSADIVGSLVKGDRLEIIAMDTEWYYVMCEDGTTGFAYADFISLGEGNLSQTRSPGSSSGATGVANSTKKTESVSISNSSSAAQTKADQKSEASSSLSYSRKGDRGEGVKEIQGKLMSYGHYDGSVDGIFGPQTETAVKKFQKANGLVSDGIVGKATIRVLLGGSSNLTVADAATPVTPVVSPITSPTIYETESMRATETSQVKMASSKPVSLDWFSTGQSLIKQNQNISIYDLNTGVVWNAKYINGSNHADVIPASANDTKKITSSKITGSYIRRPVIVTIAGTEYAGSMYAVGHGETSYCDHFDGVMCLHFTGSQTHGTKRVDEDHQNAIQVALNSEKR